MPCYHELYSQTVSKNKTFYPEVDFVREFYYRNRKTHTHIHTNKIKEERKEGKKNGGRENKEGREGQGKEGWRKGKAKKGTEL